MTFFQTSERTHKNLQKENGNFIWYQLFIETLLRMRANRCEQLNRRIRADVPRSVQEQRSSTKEYRQISG